MDHETKRIKTRYKTLELIERAHQDQLIQEELTRAFLRFLEMTRES